MYKKLGVLTAFALLVTVLPGCGQKTVGDVTRSDHGAGPTTSTSTVAPTAPPTTSSNSSSSQPAQKTVTVSPGKDTTTGSSVGAVTITVDPAKPVQPDYLAIQTQLAQLGYLPLAYTDGRFQWKYANTPEPLKSLWSPGANNVITQGAIMEFQSVHGLTVDGVVGPKTMDALSRASEANQRNPYPYSYVYVSEKRPETLTIWQDGKDVFSTKVNTGVAGAETSIGTWPVYERFTSQEMRGTNPDGSYYDDPGVPWVNYFHGGDAVHGFPRAVYGYPQSVGCVELPIDAAKTAYGYIHYGTLVTVSPN